MWLILSTASVVFCSQLVESSKTKPIPLVFLLKAQNDFPRCRPAGTYSGQGILNVSQGGRNAMQLISGKAKTRVNEKKEKVQGEGPLMALTSTAFWDHCVALYRWGSWSVNSLVILQSIGSYIHRTELKQRWMYCSVLLYAFSIAEAALVWAKYKAASNQKRERKKKSNDGAAGGRGLWVLMEVWLLKVNKSFDYRKHFLYLVQNLYPPPSSLGLSAWPDARLCFNQM